MTKNLNPSRRTIKLDFGANDPTGKRNPNTGKKESAFEIKFTKWAGKWTLTQTQALNLAGAKIENAAVFFVRHDKRITSDLLIHWGKDEYTIEDINYDDGLPPDGFDLITCSKKVVDHG